MPLKDSPVLDRIQIAVQAPGPGQFILTKSLLGSAAPLGGVMTEIDVLPDAVESVEIERGVSANALTPSPTIGTLNLQLKDPVAPLMMGAVITVRYLQPDDVKTPMFTGKISAVDVREDQVTGINRVSVVALDRVSEIANTARYGAVVDSLGMIETAHDRFTRLLAAQTQVTLPPKQPGLLWNTVRTLTDYLLNPGLWRGSEGVTFVVYGSPTAYLRVRLGTQGTATFQITGLKKGESYKIIVNGLTGVAGTDPDVYMGVDNENPQRSGYPNHDPASAVTFIAKSTSATLRFEGTGDIDLSSARLQQVSNVQPIFATTVHETNLANHLDQVATGHGQAGWWIDREGRLPVSLTARDLSKTDPAFHKTWTVKSGANTAVGELELMQGVTRSTTSQEIVNTINVRTHQTTWDDKGNLAADDRTDGPYVDITGQATYGAIVADLDTQIGDARWSERLAQDLLSWTSRPKSRIRTVPLSGQQNNPVALAQLEPFDRLKVSIGTSPAETLITGSIRHTMTPSRWLTTVTPLPM